MINILAEMLANLSSINNEENIKIVSIGILPFWWVPTYLNCEAYFVVVTSTILIEVNIELN